MRIYDRLVRFGGGVALVAAVLGIIASGVWSWSRLIEDLFVADACVEGYLDARAPSADGPARILVAGLANDAGGAGHRRILGSLERFYARAGAPVAFEVVAHDGQPCPLQPADGDAARALTAGRETAARLLADTGAELLIWGRVGGDGRQALIRLADRPPASPEGPEPAPGEETLAFDAGAAEALPAMIAARIAARIAGAPAEAWRAALMQQAVGVLRPLVETPEAGQSARARGGLLGAYARARHTIADRTGRADDLAAAAQAYRAAARAYEAAGDRAQWARARNDLGTALTALGVQEGAPGRLEEAVAAYRDALDGLPPEAASLDRATTQHNLGNALQALGAHEGGPGRLEEAVAAYRAALEGRTRTAAPPQWAATQMNLGTALATLGAREQGPERLEEAVAAYRVALGGMTRETAPEDWASTQMNLGNALQTLAARAEDAAEAPGRLEEAVAAYRAALEVRTRETAPLRWATTQMNLGNALRTLGAREERPERLESAVAAYRAALEAFTRAETPLDWALTQMNLGNALATLATLGARDAGPGRLEEAMTAYRAALDTFTRDEAPLQWAMTRGNLGNAYISAFENTGDPALLQTAQAHIEAALEVFHAAEAPFYIDRAERQLARIAHLRFAN